MKSRRVLWIIVGVVVGLGLATQVALWFPGWAALKAAKRRGGRAPEALLECVSPQSKPVPGPPEGPIDFYADFLLWSPSTRWLATGSTHFGHVLWDVSTQRSVVLFRAPFRLDYSRQVADKECVLNAGFSPDESHYFAWDVATLYVWELSKPLGGVQAPTTSMPLTYRYSPNSGLDKRGHPIALAPGGQQVALRDFIEDTRVRVLDFPSAREVSAFDAGLKPRAMVFTGKGQLVVCEKSRVRSFDPASGKLLAEAKLRRCEHATAIAGTSKVLFSGRVCDTSTFDAVTGEVWEMPPPQRGQYCPNPSPDLRLDVYKTGEKSQFWNGSRLGLRERESGTPIPPP